MGRASAPSAEGDRDLPGAPFSALVTGKLGRRGLVGWRVRSVGGSVGVRSRRLWLSPIVGSLEEEEEGELLAG